MTSSVPDPDGVLVGVRIRTSSETDDETAIEAFVVEHLTSLLGLARLLTPTEQDAEDLVQASLLRMASKWRRVSQADNRLAYVRKLMINCHTSEHRRGHLKTVALRDEFTDEERTLTRAIDRLALVAALQELPAMQRTVVVLRFHLDMTAEEIGQHTGLKPSSVRSSLSRAIENLRNSIAVMPPRTEQTNDIV